MKQKIDQNQGQLGFTLVELLAVLAIMVLLLGALVIDFASQRGKRNVLLAKNEIATNLRKVQSYMLSSKNLPTGESVKYYIATFTDEATTYTVDAIDNNYTFHANVETVKLPAYVKISDIKFAGALGGGKEDSGGQSYNCMQVIFSAPFGKMYTNATSACGGTIVGILKNPVQRAALSEKTAQIYFSQVEQTTGTSYLEVNPITGQMATY